MYRVTEAGQQLEAQIVRAQSLIERLARVAWGTCLAVGVSGKVGDPVMWA